MWKKIASSCFVLSITLLLGFLTYTTITAKNNDQKVATDQEKTHQQKAKSKTSNQTPSTTDSSKDKKVITVGGGESATKQKLSLTTRPIAQDRAPHREATTSQEKLKKTVTTLEPLSKALLNRALQNIDLKAWKTTVQLKYQDVGNKKWFEVTNDYQIVDFLLDPDLFQKMILEAVAKRINFADLIITFNYDDDLKGVAIEIAFAKKTTVTKTLYYRLENKLNLTK